MTPDRAAIDAVTTALRDRMPAGGWDLDSLAAVAVTTLQGLGWRPPQTRRPIPHEVIHNPRIGIS